MQNLIHPTGCEIQKNFPPEKKIDELKHSNNAQADILAGLDGEEERVDT